MIDFFQDVMGSGPYSMKSKEKKAMYMKIMTDLTRHHYKACRKYRNLIDKLAIDVEDCQSVDDLPFLPVDLFKDHELMSIQEADVVQVMTSSGTTGGNLSKIYLDRLNATNQKRALMKIVTAETGKKRLPMLIIDTDATLKNRRMFSGRGAGIAGFSFLGKEITYALNENMELNHEKVEAFFSRNSDSKVILFGFTYMIWEYFCKPLMHATGRYQVSDSILIHGGGWKKLLDQSVDNRTFQDTVKKVTSVGKVLNYYGMVEQTGSIFLECSAGYFHCSNFSDVITRSENFSTCGYGDEGILQLISPLATSYPGHNILSEDSGVIVGEDNCACGNNGKYFKIHGRLKEAEVRGCSDTHAGR